MTVIRDFVRVRSYLKKKKCFFSLNVFECYFSLFIKQKNKEANQELVTKSVDTKKKKRKCNYRAANEYS